jgi:hypothetical protein
MGGLTWSTSQDLQYRLLFGQFFIVPRGIIRVVERLTCIVRFVGKSMQLGTLDDRHRRSTLSPIRSVSGLYLWVGGIDLH